MQNTIVFVGDFIYALDEKKQYEAVSDNANKHGSFLARQFDNPTGYVRVFFNKDEGNTWELKD